MRAVSCEMSCEPSWQADLGVRPVGFVGLPVLFAY